jgi:hypothetical protein
MNSRRFISAPQCPADTIGSSQLDKDVGEKAGLMVPVRGPQFISAKANLLFRRQGHIKCGICGLRICPNVRAVALERFPPDVNLFVHRGIP